MFGAASGTSPIAPGLSPFGANRVDVAELLSSDPLAFVQGAALGDSSSGSTPYGSFRARCVLHGSCCSSLGLPPLHTHRATMNSQRGRGGR